MVQMDKALADKANRLFEQCAMFAGQFFEIPFPLQIGMEGYNAERFSQPLTASVTCWSQDGEIMIIFNRDWVYKSLSEHTDDIQFFMLHELRHCNQFLQIAQMKHGDETQEDKQIVKQWDSSFQVYTINRGDDCSRTENLSQIVEQDAYAYAFALHALLHRNDSDYKYMSSLPQEAARPAQALAEQYKRIKPELKRYMEGYRRYQPERNDLCPCGSGIKFKKCCMGNGVFDK